MSTRQFIALAVITTLVVGAGLTVAVTKFLPGGEKRGVSSTNPLKGHPEMVDRLVMYDEPDEFALGRMEHARLDASDPTVPARVVLDDQRTNTYPRYGYWTSPEVHTEFEFTELIPSWNASCPPNTGVRFDVRTRDARSGQWSPWMYVGQWGRTLGKRPRQVTCDYGTVHVDNLVLDRPADTYQIRAMLESFDLDTKVNPSVRRITVSYSGRVSDPLRRERLAPSVKVVGNWKRDLHVPFLPQGTAPANVRESICSPTSVTMVMSYWGVKRPLLENALAIFDADHDIFGNWNRAVARAGELGLDAHITRFRNWDQVRAMIAQGQPVVAAINFPPGQFPSAVLDETDGHLIVIRGFTESGDVIVNDPASRDKGNGATYKADELGGAWFTNAGGVGFIIRPSQASTSAGRRLPATGPTTAPTARSSNRAAT